MSDATPTANPILTAARALLARGAVGDVDRANLDGILDGIARHGRCTERQAAFLVRLLATYRRQWRALGIEGTTLDAVLREVVWDEGAGARDGERG